MPTADFTKTVRTGHSSLDVLRTRVSAALAAPTAALILIPLLVVGTGLVIAFTCRSAHNRSITNLAQARFQDQGTDASRRIEEALRQAYPLMDSVRDYLSHGGLDDPFLVYARRMRDLMRPQDAVSYISYGRANGDFIGVFRDKDGRSIATDRCCAEQTLKNWDVHDSEPKAIREEKNYLFDARTRGWFMSAMEARGRVWCTPYILFDQGIPAVAISEPLYDGNDHITGVMMINFNLNRLSAFLGKTTTDPTVRSFVFSSRRQLLAFPGYQLQEGQNRKGMGELPLITDIQEPVAEALVRQLPPNLDDAESLDFSVQGQTYLASVRPLDFGAGSKWYVATFGPLAGLREPALAAWHRSLFVAIAALAVAVAVAFLFARHLIRNQQRVMKAEQRAADAAAEVREMGAYRLVRKLGEGGMGQVWLAEHRLLSRPVAVKLISPSHLGQHDSNTTQSRFRREARTLARLESPHTIAIYDFGVEKDGALFYVMELLHGLDLEMLLAKHGPPPLGRIVSILSQAAASLAEAHDQGLIHRDVKPANIYLCRKAEQLDLVKVLGFGLVHEHDIHETRLTQEGAIQGTPAYMSPEQAQDASKITLSADIYSLACVGYRLITGQEVFQAPTAMAMVLAHVNQPPPTLAERTDRPVPQPLADLLLRCLSKDPAQRPANLHGFRAELAAIAIPEEEGWTEDLCRAWWEHASIARIEVGTAKETGQSATHWLVPQRT